jgi:hypothetical protein
MDTTQQNDDDEPLIDCRDLFDFYWKDVGIGVLKASVWIACAGAIIFIKEKGYSNYYLMIPIAIACLYTVYFCYRLKEYIHYEMNSEVCRLGGGVYRGQEEAQEKLEELSGQIGEIKNLLLQVHTTVNIPPTSEIDDISESQELQDLETIRDNS